MPCTWFAVACSIVPICWQSKSKPHVSNVWFSCWYILCVRRYLPYCKAKEPIESNRQQSTLRMVLLYYTGSINDNYTFHFSTDTPLPCFGSLDDRSLLRKLYPKDAPRWPPRIGWPVKTPQCPVLPGAIFLASFPHWSLEWNLTKSYEIIHHDVDLKMIVSKNSLQNLFQGDHKLRLCCRNSVGLSRSTISR